MAIMLETSLLIREEKGTFDLAEALRQRSGEPLEIAAITLAELLHGLERADTEVRRRRRERFIADLSARIPVIPYDAEAAKHHARVWAQLARKGTPIGPYDMVIAATALSRGCELWTANAKEFRRVPGLKVFDPTAI